MKLIDWGGRICGVYTLWDLETEVQFRMQRENWTKVFFIILGMHYINWNLLAFKSTDILNCYLLFYIFLVIISYIYNNGCDFLSMSWYQLKHFSSKGHGPITLYKLKSLIHYLYMHLQSEMVVWNLCLPLLAEIIPMIEKIGIYIFTMIWVCMY